MPTITLKNLPRDLHRALKNRAKAHHRSLNKEMIATLQTVTSPGRAPDAEAMLREAREARSKFKRPISPRKINSWRNKGRL